eukprot:GGOE01021565.1.p1 GENE.GGOE01021565.1~~GGOE01021565.1.p1  ORF type:complete len:529 (-),score=138.19 GGOE01021565.1:560-2122(-)
MAKSLRFLDFLSRCENRDYILLLDRGSSMQGLRWLEATKAVTTLLPFVCAADRDGCTLYVLARQTAKFCDMKNAAEADKHLSQVQPGGDTRLSGPLQDAIGEHFAKGAKLTSILVVTAGIVQDQLETAKVIATTSHQLKNDFELTFSFIQVGDDPKGTSFLRELSEHLAVDCKHSVVDAIAVDQMPSNLEAFLRKSGEVRHFSSASILPPAPFKQAILQPPMQHAAINTAIAKASAVQFTPTPSSPDPRARINAAIRQTTSPTSPANPHAAVDAAIRQSCTQSPPASTSTDLKLSFLDAIRAEERRDYVLLLDCSSAMTPDRWNSARQALARLGPHICRLDPDGVAMYLFNETWKKATSITDGVVLDDIFMKHVPYGNLLLGPVLNAAFIDFFSRTRKQGRPTSILVLIAGEPGDLRPTADFIVQAANTVSNAQELTVSFLQIGHHLPFVTDLASQCNRRARHAIVDGHAVGSNGSDGIRVERFIEQYYRLWPQFEAAKSFHIKEEKYIIEYHQGRFVFV